jgi:hypothetical protein
VTEAVKTRARTPEGLRRRRKERVQQKIQTKKKKHCVEGEMVKHPLLEQKWKVNLFDGPENLSNSHRS